MAKEEGGEGKAGRGAETPVASVGGSGGGRVEVLDEWEGTGSKEEGARVAGGWSAGDGEEQAGGVEEASLGLPVLGGEAETGPRAQGEGWRAVSTS